MMRLKGIDISKWNTIGAGNWNLARAESIAFIVAKCTDGINSVGAAFANQYAMIGTVGSLRTGYHWFKPYVSPESQANNFVAALKQYWQPGDMVPMVDVEDKDWNKIAPEEYANRLQKFLDIVEANFGMKPIIYTNYFYWLAALANTKQFALYPLWVASYTKKIPATFGGWANPDGSLKAIIWQYAAETSGTGAAGRAMGMQPVDCDIFFGDINALWQLTGVDGLIPLPGKKQPMVVALQAELNKQTSHEIPLVADGIWGAKTTFQLNAWQLAKGLPVEGKLSPAAWQQIFNVQYI